ncbi:hypothetical protein [Clostridium isatidis]|uniref:Uncharacterized protein n=1 Tax=Clostridium isatidis TaxID=182773 RepID=A0A343J904_9CLOT|nr:hypothetical protein [Clostridium isatidis]ASW42012.1 hypothetical protein BEN51_00350 [Clostridium isatidis]NLZ35078.1 hypothetical protein [Clostridiales bacterium]
MIFKAILLPTPRRVRKYIESIIDELNTEVIYAKDNIKKEENNVKVPDNNVKNYGISFRIY